jgi:hypothetical protein
LTSETTDNKMGTMAKKNTSADSASESLRFTKVNGILGAAGIAVLTVGYWRLAQGSITDAPLLLVLGYVVLLPMAIIR